MDDILIAHGMTFPGSLFAEIKCKKASELMETPSRPSKILPLSPNYTVQ
jgi:hypothetical protein